MITVIVHGAAGNVGREVMRAVCSDAELQAIGAVDLKADRDSIELPDRSGEVPYSANLEAIISQTSPDVMVDFSVHEASMPAVRIAAGHGVNLVIGTTGFSADDIDEIDKLCEQNGIGAVVASNFSIGAVLMMHMAKQAARHFDYAEIIEKHHERKADAPSGTALTTANLMAGARGKPFQHPELKKETLKGTRGGEVRGISVHSVRLPGFLAHQEVIFGAPGQTLSIRHDTINREAFMPGVVMAIKHIAQNKGLINGLDNLLGL